MLMVGKCDLHYPSMCWHVHILCFSCLFQSSLQAGGQLAMLLKYLLSTMLSCEVMLIWLSAVSCHAAMLAHDLHLQWQAWHRTWMWQAMQRQRCGCIRHASRRWSRSWLTARQNSSKGEVRVDQST